METTIERLEKQEISLKVSLLNSIYAEIVEYGDSDENAAFRTR